MSNSEKAMPVRDVNAGGIRIVEGDRDYSGTRVVDDRGRGGTMQRGGESERGERAYVIHPDGK